MIPINLDVESMVKESTILIVDDIPKNIQLLASFLSKEGFKLSIAQNGEEALDIAREIIPDLILLDIMMPKMDGFTVCDKLKKDKNLQHIPVIFLTAKIELADKITGFRLGSSDYITKPFQSTEVIARIHTHLKLKFTQELLRNYNSQLEEILEQRTKELIKTERHAAFSLLIKGIVHNLKNPLSVIFGSTQLTKFTLEEMELSLNENLPCDQDKITNLKKYNSSLDHSSKKLSGLIDSLMAKSRQEQTTQAAIHTLDELLTDELKFMETDLRFKNRVTKNIELSDEEITIEVIPAEFSQIIQNLIQNALDALDGQSDATLSVTSAKDSRFGWFQLTDNGPGIPQDVQDKIFDPFFTTKTKSSTEHEAKPVGTGLGLFTCAEIMKTHNGRLEVESQQGEGTTFKVIFPLVDKNSKAKKSVLL